MLFYSTFGRYVSSEASSKNTCSVSVVYIYGFLIRTRKFINVVSQTTRIFYGGEVVSNDKILCDAAPGSLINICLVLLIFVLSCLLCFIYVDISCRLQKDILGIHLDDNAVIS